MDGGLYKVTGPHGEAIHGEESLEAQYSAWAEREWRTAMARALSGVTP